MLSQAAWRICECSTQAARGMVALGALLLQFPSAPRHPGSPHTFDRRVFDDLKGALTEAFRHDGPALVDVVSARQELVMPPTTTADEAAHFSLFMMKAVLDGRGHRKGAFGHGFLFRESRASSDLPSRWRSARPNYTSAWSSCSMRVGSPA